MSKYSSEKVLSPLVGLYFESWIRTSTWFTGHYDDLNRFYKFVRAVCRFSRKRPSAYDLQKLITRKGSRTVKDVRHLGNIAREYSSLYVHLVAYHKAYIFYSDREQGGF